MNTTTNNVLADQITHLEPCIEAVEWLRKYDNWDAAWNACERGDWMLWLVGKFIEPPGSDKRRPFVLCACECARLALKYVPDGDNRPLKAIQTAESWAKGKRVNISEVRNAADAAYAAAYAAAAFAAYAADAADAADAAYSADAASDAVAAYSATAAGAARTTTLKTCSEIVRSHYPEPPANLSGQQSR